jgi:RNA polymerase sigma-70 factor (ECF subfamily)
METSSTECAQHIPSHAPPNIDWTDVHEAGNPASPRRDLALQKIHQNYWQSLYLFARSQGHHHEDAEDLVQGFFAVLIEKNHLAAADPAKGTLHAFLLTAFKHFLGKEREKANTQKRGGHCEHLSLDEIDFQGLCPLELVDPNTPDLALEHQWAAAAVRRTVDRLRAEYVRTGRARLFAELEHFLHRDGHGHSYAQAAANLHMLPGTLMVKVNRVRHQYAHLLHLEISTPTPGAQLPA